MRGQKRCPDSLATTGEVGGNVKVKCSEGHEVSYPKGHPPTKCPVVWKGKPCPGSVA